MKWEIKLTVPAQKQFSAITDKRIQENMNKRRSKVANNPEWQGKALDKELAGYRSIRAVGQRYRIIYKLEAERVVVVVVTIGIRKDKDKKDAYELAKKLARLGLLKFDF